MRQIGLKEGRAAQSKFFANEAQESAFLCLFSDASAISHLSEAEGNRETLAAQ